MVGAPGDVSWLPLVRYFTTFSLFLVLQIGDLNQIIRLQMFLFLKPSKDIQIVVKCNHSGQVPHANVQIVCHEFTFTFSVVYFEIDSKQILLNDSIVIFFTLSTLDL